MRPVAITGAGALTPIGADVAATWRALLDGTVGVTAAGRWSWAAVPAAFVEGKIDAATRRRTDRFAQYALIAAEEAVASARLAPDAERTAVVVGSTMGGLPLALETQSAYARDGAEHVTPRLMALVIPNMAAAALALRWSLHGPQLTISTACASSLDAIGRAARMIAAGECDAAIAGGTETLLAPVVAASLERAGAIAAVARPFDVARTGFVMGEGAAFVVLEDAERARRRGAPILGTVRGYGSLADAHHVTSPEPSGRWEALAMRRALDDAGLAPGDVDVVYAHGTATPVGDAAEIAAIDDVFGGRAVPVTSLKGHLGHGMAASGATSLVAALSGFRDGLVPPTAGTATVEPAARFDLVLGAPRRLAAAAAQLNAFGFGGQNASLVVARP